MTTKPYHHGRISIPELRIYLDLLDSFAKLHGRNPNSDEYRVLVADARMLAAGDASN